MSNLLFEQYGEHNNPKGSQLLRFKTEKNNLKGVHDSISYQAIDSLKMLFHHPNSLKKYGL